MISDAEKSSLEHLLRELFGPEVGPALAGVIVIEDCPGCEYCLTRDIQIFDRKIAEGDRLMEKLEDVQRELRRDRRKLIEKRNDVRAGVVTDEYDRDGLEPDEEPDREQADPEGPQGDLIGGGDPWNSPDAGVPGAADAYPDVTPDGVSTVYPGRAGG